MLRDMPEAWTEHSPSPPPVPALQASTSVRFRPDRPRQLEERNSKPASHRRSPALKPYQLKPKKGQEIFIEPPVERKEVSPPPNAKQIKCIKKNLSELNKKIRHSKRKYNNLISKRNPIKKKTKELKGLSKPEVSREPKSFNPVELEQAFYRAYRSYRINGRSRMDVDTFYNRIMQNPTPHHKQNSLSQFADDAALWAFSLNVRFAAKLLKHDLLNLAM